MTPADKVRDLFSRGTVTPFPNPENASSTSEASQDNSFFSDDAEKQPGDDAAEKLKTIRMSDVAAKPIVPIWPGVLYKGKVTVLAGIPGDGKSLSAEDVAARISKGLNWPCGDGAFERATVMLLTAEDDPADTIRPRLDVSGADCSAIELVQGAFHADKNGIRTLDAVSLNKDLPAIEARIHAIDAKFLIIDPLTSFAASDTNKTDDMRRLFDSISQMAARTGVAVLIITHLNKRSDARKAMQMIAGSHVIVAAVRVALVTARDPNDKARRLVLPIKLNIAADDGGFAFKIVVASHDVCGEVPRIEWESARVVDVSADDALIDSAPRAKAAIEKSNEVQQWLRQLLSKGPVEAGSLWRQAKEKKFSERRVKAGLRAVGATCAVAGYQGKWHYGIPNSEVNETHD